MANRLSTITTRTGDDGTTGLGDGSRVSKTDARICAMGDIDELNSAIGVLLAEPMPRSIHDRLIDIQHDLFDIGGELSIPGYALLPMSRVEALDAEIEAWNQPSPSARIHIAGRLSRVGSRPYLSHGGAAGRTQPDSPPGRGTDTR